jgi:hypothetical protein
LLGEKGKKHKYEIKFPTLTTPNVLFSCLGTTNLQIKDVTLNRCTGLITKEKRYSPMVEICTNTTLYHIEYPLSASPFEKLLILAGV